MNLRCRDLDLVNIDDIDDGKNSPEMKESDMFALTSTSIRVPAYFNKDMNYSIIKPHLDLPPQDRVTFMSPMSINKRRSKFYTETSNDSTEEIRRSKKF